MSTTHKFIPYGKQTLDESDIEAVLGVLKSDFLTQGPKIQEFEEKLAEYCGAKHAVACSNGTAALHLAYLAANLKQGDEVITSPNTFAATTNMLLAVGAKPVFCDIRLDTNNIDETKIESLITAKTKAIVPVHFAGQPCAMDTINEIAQKHNLIVIEDAAHALGARYREIKKLRNKEIRGKEYNVGSCQHSDMAIFSFHPVKPITMAEGGAVVTNDEQLYQRLKTFRNHGIHKDDTGKNVMTELGFNYRITDIQAALGISQLPKLDKFIKQRRQIVQWYEQELKDMPEIILPQEIEGNYSGWHLYIVRLRQAQSDQKKLRNLEVEKLRDKLMAYLKEKNIGANFHYPAVYKHPYYQENGFKDFSLPNEEVYHHSCITLPIFPTVTQDDIKYVCNCIKNYFIKEQNSH